MIVYGRVLFGELVTLQTDFPLNYVKIGKIGNIEKIIAQICRDSPFLVFCLSVLEKSPVPKLFSRLKTRGFAEILGKK